MTPALPYPLIETGWLAANIGAGDLKIIDASWRMPTSGEKASDAFSRRRIPGAVFFDIDEIADKSTSLPHMLPSPQQFAEAVGMLGVCADDRIVVYDDAGIFSAARVWWTFRVMGHDRVSVLDGGLPKWLAENRDIDSGAPQSPPSARYTPKTPRPLQRSAEDVRAALRAKSTLVIDARPAARFSGAAPEPRGGLRCGHMPGAANLPHSELLRADGTMRPVAELAELFRTRGLLGESAVITSCGSGVTAAVVSLALERLGHRRHALYDGSWTEWGREDNDPALFPVDN